jgi:hypothetical protein
MLYQIIFKITIQIYGQLYETITKEKINYIKLAQIMYFPTLQENYIKVIILVFLEWKKASGTQLKL